MITPALLGGVFVGVLSALPVINIANCCCIWFISGGMLAAYLDPGPQRPGGLGRGAIEGLLAGVVGAFVWLFVSMAIDPLMGAVQSRIVEQMLERSSDLPPDVRRWLEAVGESAGPLQYAVGFMFQLIGGLIFSTLGGLLGALFFWREDVPPAIGGPQPPPPLPPQY